MIETVRTVRGRNFLTMLYIRGKLTLTRLLRVIIGLAVFHFSRDEDKRMARILFRVLLIVEA